MQCYDGTIVHRQGTTYAVLVMECCEGGTLFDLLHRYRDKRLSEEQVLFVLRHLVEGVRHLHSQVPPVAHRDIKVENILLHEKVFKLCDFGSASTDVLDFA